MPPLVVDFRQYAFEYPPDNTGGFSLWSAIDLCDCFVPGGVHCKLFVARFFVLVECQLSLSVVCAVSLFLGDGPWDAYRMGIRTPQFRPRCAPLTPLLSARFGAEGPEPPHFFFVGVSWIEQFFLFPYLFLRIANPFQASRARPLIRRPGFALLRIFRTIRRDFPRVKGDDSTTFFGRPIYLWQEFGGYHTAPFFPAEPRRIFATPLILPELS